MSNDPPNLIEHLNDTEGLAWGLYYHLWKKTHKGEACPNINIPHTVVYQDSTPIAWYFMSSKDNKIYRKKKCNITGSSICEAMAHKHPEVDACAWFSGTMTFMSATPKKKRVGSGGQAGEVYELEPEEDTKEPACFDFWTKDRLQRLVAPGQYTAITESIYDGVLQKFIMPREAYDHVIRAIWSPTACVCERRCSNFSLTDERQTLPDRMASFDANTFWLSTHQPLPAGSVLVQRLTTACESIVRHLAETSAGKISVARMQLYFKVDTHNRIWLTLCNSLRLDRTAWNVDRSPTPIKYGIKDTSRQHEEDTRLPEDPTPFMCVVTGATHPGADRCDVSYKLLIADWFKQVAELEEESDRMQALDNIPPAIRRANPNITREYYLRMRAQPAFLLKTAPVCRAAAGDVTASALKDLSRTIARPRSALADSAVLRQIAYGGGSSEEAAAATAAAQAKPLLAASTGRIKLMVTKGPPPPPPSDPNVLYEPGAQIPVALIPKALLSSSGAGTLRSTGGRSGGAGTTTMVPVVRPQQQQQQQQQSLGAVAAAGAGAPPPPVRQQQQQHPQSARPQAHATRPVQLPMASTSGPLLAAGRDPASPARVKHTTAYVVPGPRAAPVAAATVPSGTAGKGAFDPRPSKPQAPPPQAAERLIHSGEPYNPGAKRPTSAKGSAPALPVTKAAGAGRGDDGTAAGAGAGVIGTRTSHVSSEDLRTLKELSDAYASAEAVTQQLLAEAQDILGESATSSVTQAAAGTGAAAGAHSSSSGTPPKPGSGNGSAKGSRPVSAKPPGSSKPPSGSGAGSGMLQPKEGGVVAGAAASGSRPGSAVPASGSRPGSAALQPKEGGVTAGAAEPATAAAGLTADEAALLSDALGQSQEQ